MNAPSQLNGIKSRRELPPIRVMIVDDSVVTRIILKQILESNASISIVSEADRSEKAIISLRETQVDIILLDIEMPNQSGLDALPELVRVAQGARILLLSAFAEEHGPAAIKALSLGACDTLCKPGRAGFSGRFSELLMEKVLRLGSPQIIPDQISSAINIPADAEKPHCIAIGASTGGIPAIFDVIRNINVAINCPIFITQHLPDAFMVYFVRQLAEHTARTVVIAEPGVEVKGSHIYVARGNAHLVCRRKGSKVRIASLDQYSESRYCPSVDALFESVATTYGRNSIAIILSGMGNDGVIGARLLKQSGAQILAQDSASSVIWGMPGSVVREGLASAVLSPINIGHHISSMVTR